MDGGAVHRAPYEGARALLEWVLDVWPYANGRALMSGLRLQDMEGQEMLDVIHFMLEDDLNLVSAEQAESRTKTRAMVYDILYNRSYKYGKISRQSNTSSAGFDFDTDAGFVNNPDGGPIPFDPSNGPRISEDIEPVRKKPKAYVPPTDFNPDAINPFGKILDSPMN